MFLLLPLFSFYYCVSAQDFWEQLPFPYEVSIMCIATNDQGDIFVGAGNDGDNGGVYRSIDNGQTWEFVLDVYSGAVLSIDINEQGTIYAGTNIGITRLFVSYNNGIEWGELSLPTTVNVVKILCASTDTVYVSQWLEGGAFLLRSSDSCATWDTIYTSDHVSEYVSDIAISSSGVIYISLDGFFFEMGGVYRSADNGQTWECAGLFNYQVMALEFNHNNDLLIGVWSGFYDSGGLFVLINGESEIQALYPGPVVWDLVINSDDDIYFSVNGGGVIRTLDMGQTFEFVNQGLIGYGHMAIDNLDYIYNGTASSNNIINRTIEPTVTSVVSYSDTGFHKLEIILNTIDDRLRASIIGSDIIRGTGNFIISDLAGRAFINGLFDIANKYLQTDISGLAPGMYILSIKIDNASLSSKFIKP